MLGPFPWALKVVKFIDDSHILHWYIFFYAPSRLDEEITVWYNRKVCFISKTIRLSKFLDAETCILG